MDGRDLGSVMSDINPLVKEMKKDLPRGTTINVRGQAETTISSYIGLGTGLVMAIVLMATPFSRRKCLFPQAGQPVHHHDRAAWRAGGRHLVPLFLMKPPCSRPASTGRHHVHGRRHGQFRARGVFRPGKSPQRHRPSPLRSTRALAASVPLVMTEQYVTVQAYT